MKLDHIGVAVKSIKERLAIWQDLLGLKLQMIEEVPQQKVKVAVLKLGDINIELLEPIESESPVAKFIEKRGEGIHHICFEVENIKKVLSDMKNKGIKLVDNVPSKGAYAEKIAFIHPKDMGGVLIELCEK
jgi:methylmalonyl-CoA/ethylmalonyl-CoA epimerase